MKLRTKSVFFGLLTILPLGIYGAVSGQSASGGAVELAVKDKNGMPVRDAVVMIYPAKGTGGRGFSSSRAVMSQKNVQFNPGTLIVGKGTTVSFPNRDRVRHNIYSFSKAAKFKMKLYGRDESRSHAFPIVGTVALGCNIHDQMKGYIKVVDTPFAAKTDHNGLVQLDNLPTGAAKVKIWHPQNRVRGSESAFPMTIQNRGKSKQTVKLALRK